MVCSLVTDCDSAETLSSQRIVYDILDTKFVTRNFNETINLH